MKIKSKLNVKLLRKIQKFLLKEPRSFDMSDWITPSNHSCVLKQPSCGTALCIAGAAYVIEKKINLKSGFDQYPEPSEVRSFAAKVLGLRVSFEGTVVDNKIPDTRLSSIYDWPVKFMFAYRKAKTPLQRAKVGVRRIDHFINTNGAE